MPFRPFARDIALAEVSIRETYRSIIPLITATTVLLFSYVEEIGDNFDFMSSEDFSRVATFVIALLFYSRMRARDNSHYKALLYAIEKNLVTPRQLGQILMMDASYTQLVQNMSAFHVSISQFSRLALSLSPCTPPILSVLDFFQEANHFLREPGYEIYYYDYEQLPVYQLFEIVDAQVGAEYSQSTVDLIDMLKWRSVKEKIDQQFLPLDEHLRFPEYYSLTPPADQREYRRTLRVLTQQYVDVLRRAQEMEQRMLEFGSPVEFFEAHEDMIALMETDEERRITQELEQEALKEDYEKMEKNVDVDDTFPVSPLSAEIDIDTIIWMHANDLD